MTASRDILAFIDDILGSIEQIKIYVTDVTEREFENDLEKQDAVIRRIEIIGEAVKNIPDNIRKSYPNVPWRQLAGMRDVVIHEYFGITLSIVWKTANADLPRLKEEFERIRFDITSTFS